MGKQSNARTTLIKIVVTCLVVALSFGIIFIGEYSIAPDEDSAESAATADMSFTPGTYTATAPGMESDVEVTATFDEDSITDVSIDVSGETAGIGAEIGDEMTQQFLSAQSAAVDGVSGATVTSGALKDAMQDCIDQATGGSAEADGTGEETGETAETEDMTEAATEETEAAQAGIEAEETAADEEPEASTATGASGAYIPGTYFATAEGNNGEISVSVTFTENAIVSISSDLSGETEYIGAFIGPEISKQILDAQSTDVDGVSQATVTSDAVKEAVNDCIAQASTGNASSSESGYTPGAYTAEAEGMSSTVTVTLQFNEDSILSAACDVSGETEDIGAVIGPEICKRILDAQSADIDGVSGATVTSDAVKEAAEECIANARGEE